MTIDIPNIKKPYEWSHGANYCCLFRAYSNLLYTSEMIHHPGESLGKQQTADY